MPFCLHKIKSLLISVVSFPVFPLIALPFLLLSLFIPLLPSFFTFLFSLNLLSFALSALPPITHRVLPLLLSFSLSLSFFTFSFTFFPDRIQYNTINNIVPLL